MDVGQRVCKPRRPNCADCPAIAWCAYAAGVRPAVVIGGSRAAPRRPEPAFESTNRWLRGRILERARDAHGWIGFDDAIGEHGPGAVRAAVIALARDGLLDIRETPSGLEARLPH